MANRTLKGGGSYSKFAPTPTEDPETWPLLTIGQDEATFKSQSFKKGIWAQDNIVPLFPKSLGHGRMVSAFFSREHGFHFEVTDEQLEQIDAMRAGQPYLMQDVAKEERSGLTV